MIKRFLIGFMVLISAFLFTNKVSAETLGNIEISNTNINTCESLGYNYYTVFSGNFNRDGKDKENLFLCSYYPGTFTEHNSTSDMDWQVSLQNQLRDYTQITWESSMGFYTTKILTSHVDSPYKLFYQGNDITKNYTNYGNGWLGNLAIKTTARLNFTVHYTNYDMLISGSPYEDRIGTVYHKSNISKNPAIDTVNKVITIPINYFYNDGNWQNYYLYFASPTINNMNYSLTFSYENDLSGLPSLPVELIINDKVENVLQHLADITNSKHTAENGFGGGFSLDAGNFGGGGGGGRFDDTETNSCMSTQPFTYNGNFSNENVYGLVALSLNSCADLTGKTPDDFSTKSIKISYDARIIDLSTDPSGPSSDAIGDMLEDIRNEYELEQEEIKFEIFQPVLKLINDKLPIINQFSQILNQFNFDEEINEPPVFKVNIPYFNLNDIEVFNFQFFIPYRDYVLGLECFFLAWFTAVRTYKIVKGYFGGGNNE